MLSSPSTWGRGTLWTTWTWWSPSVRSVWLIYFKSSHSSLFCRRSRLLTFSDSSRWRWRRSDRPRVPEGEERYGGSNEMLHMTHALAWRRRRILSFQINQLRFSSFVAFLREASWSLLVSWSWSHELRRKFSLTWKDRHSLKASPTWRWHHQKQMIKTRIYSAVIKNTHLALRGAKGIYFIPRKKKWLRRRLWT